MAKLYSVGVRLKAHEMNYSTARDFALSDEREAPASIILEQPGWSPYCIDHEAGELVLTRLPASIDLAKSSFYFVAQYRQAEQVLKLPLAEIEPLTAGLPDPTVVVIYSIGRCGTTLASLALNQSPHAWSLGEPEVFNHQSLMLRPEAPISGGTFVRAMIRLIFAQRAKRGATTLALKLRSQSLFSHAAVHRRTPPMRAPSSCIAMRWAGRNRSTSSCRSSTGRTRSSPRTGRSAGISSPAPVRSQTSAASSIWRSRTPASPK